LLLPSNPLLTFSKVSRSKKSLPVFLSGVYILKVQNLIIAKNPGAQPGSI
jgi:hypothetical protein